jgi:CheY-like chemotaxis protein
MIRPDENGADLMEYIKTDESVTHVPLILITNSDLSDEDMKELDGRIRATFNKAVLAEDDLLETLKNTIRKM